ncbi:thioredoxin family protein [Halobacillus shinanisalinarum]|uniref:Thioredoxin family protein n=1 Tax=Halobacillus shinanisalinarum TaxID=2932258 RepID=A0ABY4GWE2_9BACI|nr:thioredoxin family protein [Halobacillus shinanisalinarum]UOQ92486.1 thioredoxin family protein [Halobacillus shinanisalinarum]
MRKVQTIEEVQAVINDELLSFVYISSQGCSVCHSLLPQIEKLLEEYPRFASIHVDANEVKAIAGTYIVFTVPAVIVFSKGKELFRKARFVPMEKLNQQLAKYSQFI